MALKWILCLLLTITIPPLSEGIKVCNDTKSKNEICSVKEGYEKRSPPSPDTPTEVELVFNLWQVLDVDEDKQIITMSTEVDAFWKDNRLSMSNGSTLKFFSVSDLVDQLWIPEMTFPNTVKLEKAAGFEKQTLNSIQLINMPYMPNMAIINMLLIAFKCQMDFETFPFDHHHCEWQIRSYDKGINEVLFNFPSLYTIVDGTYEEVPKDETMKVNNSGLPFDVEVQALPPTEISAGGSKFSMISIQIHLKRKSKEFHKLLISYYFPTGSFGILSTFSFFVKPDVVPGRMGMLITSFLVVTSIYGSIEAPVSRGFSFIEEWYIGIQVPIILALAEYGFILGMIKLKKLEMNQKYFGYRFEDMLRILDLTSFCISVVFIFIFKTYYLNKCSAQ